MMVSLMPAVALAEDEYMPNAVESDNIKYFIDYENKTALAESVDLFDEDDEWIGYAKPGKLRSYVTVAGVNYPVTSIRFYDNNLLTDITLPATVESLETDDLVNTGLTSITIPSTVRMIQSHAVGFTNTLVGSYDYEYAPVPGFIIYGKSGSAAESYAKAWGIRFVDIYGGGSSPKAADSAEAARQGVYNSKLPKVTASKPKAAKKAVTVKWKKLSKKNQKKAQKIELWVCPNKAFAASNTVIKTVSKKKTSVKVKGLKAKTKYFVKVRSIKYVGGVKQVGKWSKVKKIKTK